MTSSPQFSKSNTQKRNRDISINALSTSIHKINQTYSQIQNSTYLAISWLSLPNRSAADLIKSRPWRHSKYLRTNLLSGKKFA